MKFIVIAIEFLNYTFVKRRLEIPLRDDLQLQTKMFSDLSLKKSNHRVSKSGILIFFLCAYLFKTSGTYTFISVSIRCLFLKRLKNAIFLFFVNQVQVPSNHCAFDLYFNFDRILYKLTNIFAMIFHLRYHRLCYL